MTRSREGSPGPRVGVVVPTVGENHHLDRLFGSLVNQEHPPHKVVVVTQGDAADWGEVLGRWAEMLPIDHLTCGRGVSRARNIGTGWVLRECDIAVFLDDDVWLEPHSLRRAAECLRTGPAAVSGSLLDADGTPHRDCYPGRARELDDRSVWRVTYETTTAFTRCFWELAGPLDEQLGLGAATRWLSGEGTDFLLRGMRNGGRVSFDPEIRFFEDPFVGESPAHLLRRHRQYARGTGAVYRRHYGPTRAARMAAGPLLRAALHAVRGDLNGARTEVVICAGRLDGYVTAWLRLRASGGA